MGTRSALVVLLSLFFGCGDDAAPIDGGDDVATTDATRDVAEDVEADMSEPDAEADCLGLGTSAARRKRPPIILTTLGKQFLAQLLFWAHYLNR